jgi:hypothetical protein
MAVASSMSAPRIQNFSFGGGGGGGGRPWGVKKVIKKIFIMLDIDI